MDVKKSLTCIILIEHMFTFNSCKCHWIHPSIWVPLRLSCRTGCRALCASLRTVSWVMREVAGGTWWDGMVAPVTNVEGLKIYGEIMWDWFGTLGIRWNAKFHNVSNVTDRKDLMSLWWAYNSLLRCAWQGNSLRQVNALVPSSALETPAQTTAGPVGLDSFAWGADAQ